MATTESEVLGGSSAPVTITHRGKIYKARVCDKGFKSHVQRTLEERSKRPALDLAADVSPETLAHLLHDHTEKMRAKAFRWCGPEHLEWLLTPEGVLGFTRLVFEVDEATAIEFLIETGAETCLAIKQVVYESLSPPERAAWDERERAAREKAAQQGASAEDPFSLRTVSVLPERPTPETPSN